MNWLILTYSLFLCASVVKMYCNYSSDMHKLHAVASAEPAAEVVQFQRDAAGKPPVKNDDSAVSPVLPARQFSGDYAKSATVGSPLGHNMQQLLHLVQT